MVTKWVFPFLLCIILMVESVYCNSIFDTIGGYVNKVVEIFSTEDPSKSIVNHLNNVSVVDFSQSGYPKVRLGHRVVDLFSGWHFDDILMDSPDAIRPAGVVVFFDSSNSQCMSKYSSLNFDNIAETQLPARSQLFTARYDIYSAKRRVWYEFTPEMDLEKRFEVKSCPEVHFITRKCDGFTEWCVRGKDPEDERINVLGCDNFKESCPKEARKVWNGKDNLVNWIKDNLNKEEKPKLTKFLGSYHEQGRWLQKREYTTCNTHFRNAFLAKAFPAFTYRGFKVLDTPEVFQVWLEKFMKDYDGIRKTEFWNAESTQMSFHEKPTTFIDMDKVRKKKEQMADEYIKPLLEDWSGMKPLELTSFYGMREYHEGAWLRQHVDRIDTHVLSVTFSVAKKNFTFDEESAFPYKPWPLQVTDWTGKQVAYDHPPGTMILYESSKLPHGRPTRNEGGIHVGCFVHYKPMNMHGSEAKKWDDISSTAREYQRKQTQFANFRATEEIEPKSEKIVYAEVNVGEGSAWSKKNEKKGNSKDTSFQVSFKNTADRDLDLFWYQTIEAEHVLQGTVSSGSAMSLTSYHGHKFFWAEKGTTKAIVGGKLTVDIGKKTYGYNLKKDGTRHKEGL